VVRSAPYLSRQGALGINRCITVMVAKPSHVTLEQRRLALDLAEAAKLIGCSTKSLQRAIGQRRLKARKQVGARSFLPKICTPICARCLPRRRGRGDVMSANNLTAPPRPVIRNGLCDVDDLGTFQWGKA
jgi:hypothetical protein